MASLSTRSDILLVSGTDRSHFFSSNIGYQPKRKWHGKWSHRSRDNGLPPILVLTGTHDLLNSDAHRLQTLMTSQPGALKMIEYRNMLHVWPSLPIPEARQAMDQILTFMQIDSHQERPRTVGGEGNPPVPAPTKISGMPSATDDATQIKASDHSPAVVSRP